MILNIVLCLIKLLSKMLQLLHTTHFLIGGFYLYMLTNIIPDMNPLVCVSVSQLPKEQSRFKNKISQKRKLPVPAKTMGHSIQRMANHVVYFFYGHAISKNERVLFHL